MLCYAKLGYAMLYYTILSGLRIKDQGRRLKESGLKVSGLKAEVGGGQSDLRERVRLYYTILYYIILYYTIL